MAGEFELRFLDHAHQHVMIEEEARGERWSVKRIEEQLIVQQELERQLADVTTLEALVAAGREGAAEIPALQRNAREQARSILAPPIA